MSNVTAQASVQAEMQPVAWQCRCVCAECIDADWSCCSFEQYQMALADPEMQARALFAAPVAQAELVMPVALGAVSADYGKGWADHAAEVRRLNAELLPSTPC